MRQDFAKGPGIIFRTDDYNVNDSTRCEEIMRRFLAIVLSILIGVQGIVLIPGGMRVQAEDMTESTEENESGESV